MWRPIPGFEESHEVSADGRVRSVPRTVHFSDGRVRSYPGKELAQYQDQFGYRKVTLRCRPKDCRVHVHALVALVFIGPRPEGMQVCHSNGDRQDNRLENLRYDTCAGNHADMLTHGTRRVGERAPAAKLSNARVGEIKAAKGGMTLGEAAAAFGVSKNHICNIWNGRRRKHA